MIQEPLGRRVAVKVLPRHALADARARERFFREAKAVARLGHPHIVPIHAMGEQDGTPYYVMPLIDGAGLDRILADPVEVVPDDPGDRALWAAALGLQAAGALAHAHEEGILHRDIKPANLLLDAAGTLWLADFGLAKLADELALTGTGELPGTLRYLAPECLRVEPDARSDVYSLGLTLYELLVGRPAFGETDRVRLLHQIESAPVVAPRMLVPGVPRDLETIVLKASSHEPSARYASASAMADDLARFLGGRPILGRRASAVERLDRWRRRNPVVSMLAALTVVLALFGGYFFALYLAAPRPPGQLSPARPRLRSAARPRRPPSPGPAPAAPTRSRRPTAEEGLAESSRFGCDEGHRGATGGSSHQCSERLPD